MSFRVRYCIRIRWRSRAQKLSPGASLQVLGRRKSCHFDEVRGEILYVEISRLYKISLRPLPQSPASAYRNDKFGRKLYLLNTCRLESSDCCEKISRLPLKLPSAYINNNHPQKYNNAKSDHHMIGVVGHQGGYNAQ